MAESSVTATLNVTFSSASSGVLWAEIDGRSGTDGGLNGGDTSFAPGDPFWYLVKEGENVSVTDQLWSIGGGGSKTTSAYNVEEFVVFTSPDGLKQNLQLPVNGGPVTWTPIGTGSGTGNFTGTPSYVGGSSNQYKHNVNDLTAFGVKVYKVTYTVVVDAYKHTHSIPSASPNEYQINGVIVGVHAP